MRTWRLNPIVIGLLLATVPLASAAGRTERTRTDDVVVADPEGGPGTVRLATTGVGEPSGGVAGGQACEQIAEYLDLNSGVNRMRGNVYEIGDIPAVLDEFKMELDFTAPSVDLFFAVYREDDESANIYNLVDLPTQVTVDGIGQAFYSSGQLLDGKGKNGLPLDAHTRYILYVAWGSTTIIYGRDIQGGYPKPFSQGTVLGSVGSNGIDPADLPGSLFQVPFPGAAYSTRVCLQPIPGAC